MATTTDPELMEAQLFYPELERAIEGLMATQARFATALGSGSPTLESLWIKRERLLDAIEASREGRRALVAMASAVGKAYGS